MAKTSFILHVHTTCNTETRVSLVKGWHSHTIISTMGYQLRLSPQHLLISHATGQSLMMVCTLSHVKGIIPSPVSHSCSCYAADGASDKQWYIPMAACSQRIGILMQVAAAWELPLKVLQEAVHGLPATGTPFHPTKWSHSSMPVGC